MYKYLLILTLCLVPVFVLAQDTSTKTYPDSIDIKSTPVFDDKDKPFTTVEQMPSFPGGEEEMMRFIANNFAYPDSVRELGLQGRLTARFVVERDGSLSNITMIRGIDSNLDCEFVRLIQSMPQWIPGKQDGETVRVYFTLPMSIHFKQ